jgi:hypothetical protein
MAGFLDLLPDLTAALVKEVATSGPQTSVLAGADPYMRGDVCLSRVAERAVTLSGNPALGAAFQQVKPTMDLILERTFTGTIFGKPKQVRTRTRRKAATRRRSRQVVRP